MQKGRKVGCGTLPGRSPSSAGRAEPLGVGPKSRFLQEKSHPEGRFWGQAGRPSGSQMVVFILKLSKNHEKVDPGGGSEKVQKNDGKMMPEVGVLGR